MVYCCSSGGIVMVYCSSTGGIVVVYCSSTGVQVNSGGVLLSYR